MKIFVFNLLLILTLAACENSNYFSKMNGQINADKTVRIEFYSGKKHFQTDSITKPKNVIVNKALIKEIINEINFANDPGPWKGAGWDRLYIIQSDTTIILNTDGKVIGGHYGSGQFYKLKAKSSVNKYLNRK